MRVETPGMSTVLLRGSRFNSDVKFLGLRCRFYNRRNGWNTGNTASITGRESWTLYTIVCTNQGDSQLDRLRSILRKAKAWTSINGT